MRRHWLMALAVAMAAACGGEPETAPPAPASVPEAEIDPEGAPEGEEIEPILAEDDGAGAPWLGVWAADPSWCALTPGAGDPAPIAFAADEFIGFENRCTIASVEALEDGAARLELLCLGEGVEYQEYMDVAAVEGGLSVKRGEGPAVAFARCR